MSRKDHNFDTEEKKYEYVPPETVQKEEKPKKAGSHSQNYVLFAGALIVGIIIGAVITPSLTGNVASTSSGVKGIGSEAASQKLIEYFNLNPAVDSAVYAGLASSGSYYYEVIINITSEGQTQSLPIKVSLDGKEVMQTTDLDDLITQTEQAIAQEQQSTEIPKSDKPKVDIFIMSYCPYGLQMQKAALPVMELLGDKADITVKWVDYIMHGKKEIDENTVQYCIQKEQADKYIAYATCFTQTGITEDCQTQAGIDAAKLDACIAVTDEDFNITGMYNDKNTWVKNPQGVPTYPQYPVDAAENNQFGVGGSPTVVINGVQAQVTRSPEAVKQAVCNAFNTPPEECSTTLSTVAASSGIGGGTGTGTAATCS